MPSITSIKPLLLLLFVRAPYLQRFKISDIGLKHVDIWPLVYGSIYDSIPGSYQGKHRIFRYLAELLDKCELYNIINPMCTTDWALRTHTDTPRRSSHDVRCHSGPSTDVNSFIP